LSAGANIPLRLSASHDILRGSGSAVPQRPKNDAAPAVGNAIDSAGDHKHTAMKTLPFLATAYAPFRLCVHTALMRFSSKVEEHAESSPNGMLIARHLFRKSVKL
jgi:hypothetical protein